MKKIGIIIFILITTYAFWNARNLISGPRIKVSSILKEAPRSSIEIAGVAKNISFLTLNGRKIFIDERGNFKEEIVLLSGLNIIELRGKDRFGKEKVESLALYGKPGDRPIHKEEETASSTAISIIN